MKFFKELLIVTFLTVFTVNLQAVEIDKAGNTIIHRYARDGKFTLLKDIIQRRGKEDIDINLQNNKQNTPLHHAARNGRIKVLRFLLKTFKDTININARNFVQNTPLHSAVGEDRVQAVKILVNNGADINLINKKGLKPIDLARSELQIEKEKSSRRRLTTIIKFLEKKETKKEPTEFIRAPKPAEVKIEPSVTTGVSPFKKDKFGNTIIHQYARDGKFILLKYTIQQRGEENIDINMQNNQQNTPLHHAARHGRIKVLRFLLNTFKDTININARNFVQNTPLHSAAREDRVQAVKILVNNGADRNLINKNDLKPIDLARNELKLEKAKIPRKRLTNIIKFLEEKEPEPTGIKPKLVFKPKPTEDIKIEPPVTPTGFPQLGLGARQIGVTQEEINRLLALPKNDAVEAALDIIKSADFADLQDPIILAEYIRDSESTITAEDVIERMRQDREKVVEALKEVDTFKRTFEAQLGQSRGSLLRAIEILEKHPGLMKGEIPEEYQGIHGTPLRNLRAALFYIARMENEKDIKQLIPQLGGFYEGKLQGSANVKRLLRQTLLVHDGTLISPATSYVKRGVQARKISPSLLRGPKAKYTVHLTDCSGFILAVARKITKNPNLKVSNGLSSGTLAALFDSLTNIRHDTSTRFYGIDGGPRKLTKFEINPMNNLERRKKQYNNLRRVFSAVEKTKNIRGGDIMIVRHPKGYVRKLKRGREGHVLLVIDNQHPSYVVVELAAGKKGTGYGWRKIRIDRGFEYPTRFLRIKRPKK